jgi:uncharacterized membrane protein
MSDLWADIFARFLLLSSFIILLIAAILMAINSYISEKTNKPTTPFETAAKVFVGLWFLNGFALGIFGILSEWFSLAKWEIWATYIIAFLIGLVIWLLSKKIAPKKDRSLTIFLLLFFALIITSVIAFVALLTGRY